MPRAAKLLLRTSLLTFVAVASTAAQPIQSNLPKGETPVTGMYPEVRLRKLHLVRPDLIPYPIAFEVCC